MPAGNLKKSAPVKILHVINGEYYAGAERVQDLIAKNLPALGYEVGFACLTPDKFPSLRHYKDAPVYLLPMRFSLDIFRVFDLIKIIKAENYALIHTHYARTDLLGAIAASITGIPLVIHMHSRALTDTDSFCKSRLNTIIERLCLYKASQAIFVSHKLQHTMQLPENILKKAQVIHNGVPVVQHLAAHTLNKSKIVIGAVAFWRPGKGLSVLFQALKKLKGSGKEFRLRIVGGFVSEQYRQHYTKMAREYGIFSHIDWIGATSEVYDELQKMDIFVLPSLNEGLPMVILEAMAAGVPVVASNVGGIPEAIRNGTDGLLVPAGEPELLAQAIEEMLSDERQWHKIRQNAYERQQALFSERKMTDDLANVYNKILSA